MRKYKWILWFFLFTFLVDRGLGILAGKSLLKNSFYLTKIFQDGPGVDILMLGNSRIFTLDKHLIEKATHLSSFQIGYNGLPLNLAEVLVRDYCDHHELPQKFIIDISICDRKNDPLVNQFSPFLGSSKRLDSLTKATDPNYHFWMSVSHALRYNSEVYYRTLVNGARKNDQFLSMRKISPEAVETFKNKLDWGWSVYPSMLNSLFNIIQFAQDRGIEVILIIAPVLPHLEGKLTNLDGMMAQIKSKTGLPIHNFLFTVQEDSLFSDNLHVNQTGSKEYTKQVLNAGILD